MVGTASPPRERTARPERWLDGRAMPLVPAAVALAVALAGIRGPSYWLDEAATVSMAGRPVPEMLRAFGNLDLVHALYYLMLRPWAMVFGTGEPALRVPSALAAAAAAAGVAVIGRRCLGPGTGLLAGLVYGASVSVCRFAQEARPYAMVAAVAVLATYLLIRGMREGERHPWAWFAGYGAAVAVLGLLNLNGLFLVPAHGITLLLARTGAPRTWVRWPVVTGLTGVALLPFALAAQDQKFQVEWLTEPSWATVWTLVQFMAGGRRLVAPVVALLVLGAVTGRSPRAAEPASLAAVAAPWLVAPPALLLLVSVLAEPMFTYRYVVFSLPALALLVGAGLARLAALGRPAAGAALLAVATAAVVVPTLPEHAAIRRQDSRLDDLRTPADIVRDRARDGDAILYLAGVVRWNASAYPDAFGRLRDIGMREDPVSAANLKGRDRFPRDLRAPLRREPRLWVMGSRSLGRPLEPPVVRRNQIVQESGPWRIAGHWNYRGGNITLYVRTAPYRTSK
ncbi:hypothetical protein E1281_21150 [Actinomadura sp. KC345]|uniref:glycosyltransferase family 39 protein n=1 Tax=Actinomadura sp. KC345 TaxID=2530371 RepID=UPI00104750B0|nr:glycosyltransferase family 39 protein [Actinomadura sp. KC345]TDC51030.1 hypothetical protein E1281_21150 [Actinomadura sp. KC345]